MRDVITGCKERGWSITIHDEESALAIKTPTQSYRVIGIGSRHERRPITVVRYDKVIEAASDDFSERFVAAMIDLYDLVCYEEDRIHGNT